MATRIELRNRKALIVCPPDADGTIVVLIENKRGRWYERIWLHRDEAERFAGALLSEVK